MHNDNCFWITFLGETDNGTFFYLCLKSTKTGMSLVPRKADTKSHLSHDWTKYYFFRSFSFNWYTSKVNILDSFFSKLLLFRFLFIFLLHTRSFSAVASAAFLTHIRKKKNPKKSFTHVEKGFQISKSKKLFDFKTIFLLLLPGFLSFLLFFVVIRAGKIKKETITSN